MKKKIRKLRLTTVSQSLSASQSVCGAAVQWCVCVEAEAAIIAATRFFSTCDTKNS